MKERILDLIFLIGVLFKGIDGLIELIGGLALLVLSPAQLLGAVTAVTAHELAEDPHDILDNLLIHGVQHLAGSGLVFIALYLLFHGVVKLAIVIALLLGSRRVYPWAIAVLIAFLGYQVYELVVAPSVGIVLLSVFDAVIIALTWREWRHGRTLHQTMRSTIDWVLRRTPTRAAFDDANES